MSTQGIVQYILVRADLCKTLGWPVGALVAQACHASTAVVHMFYNHEDTQKYLADLDNMHKIVLSVRRIYLCFIIYILQCSIPKKLFAYVLKRVYEPLQIQTCSFLWNCFLTELNFM